MSNHHWPAEANFSASKHTSRFLAADRVSMIVA